MAIKEIPPALHDQWDEWLTVKRNADYAQDMNKEIKDELFKEEEDDDL